MKYILKNGMTISSIPVGKSSVKIGQVSPDGWLTVCGRAEGSTASNGARVICKCICGNYIVTSWANFRNGHTKSCGCKNQEIFRKNGKRVGILPKNGKDYSKVKNPYYIFNKRLDKKKGRSYYWDIICRNCGKHYEEIPVEVISDTRRRGNNPCSCWRHTSKGVLKITKLLEDANISFVKEKTFESCQTPLGHLCKFDFYVNNEYLIEYDGEQHFSPQSFGDKEHSGEEKLQKQKKYDNIKNEWCIKNKIPLIRISYKNYENMTLADLQLKTTKFLYTGEKNNV